jgi:hypothetical protein
MSYQSPIRLIGTFHKTGTVLWRKILITAQARGGVTHWHVNRNPEPDHWHIAFDFHSKTLFQMIKANPTNFRGVF